jgi:hypothetical protein
MTLGEATRKFLGDETIRDIADLRDYSIVPHFSYLYAIILRWGDAQAQPTLVDNKMQLKG